MALGDRAIWDSDAFYYIAAYKRYIYVIFLAPDWGFSMVEIILR